MRRLPFNEASANAGSSSSSNVFANEMLRRKFIRQAQTVRQSRSVPDSDRHHRRYGRQRSRRSLCLPTLREYRRCRTVGPGERSGSPQSAPSHRSTGPRVETGHDGMNKLGDSSTHAAISAAVQGPSPPRSITFTTVSTAQYALLSINISPSSKPIAIIRFDSETILFAVAGPCQDSSEALLDYL